MDFKRHRPSKHAGGHLEKKERNRKGERRMVPGLVSAVRAAAMAALRGGDYKQAFADEFHPPQSFTMHDGEKGQGSEGTGKVFVPADEPLVERPVTASPVARETLD